MATTSTNLTVTIVTATTSPGEEDLLLEAEINSDDNNGESTYYVNRSYYLRLYKSTNISSLIKACNIGSVSLVASGQTAPVPSDPNEPEYLTFSGSDSASLDKVYQGNFSATPVGQIFDENGQATSASLTPPTPGSKEVKASKKIYGVYEVSYTTKYDKYMFSSPVVGQMLILFIGSGS